MDRLFRQSALYRDKWDEMRGAMTYGERTITKALGAPGQGNEQPSRTSEANGKKGRAASTAPQERSQLTIQTNNRSLDEVTDDALQALVAANYPKPDIFVRGGVLCRVRRNEHRQYIIEPLTVPMLKHSLAQCALSPV